MLKSRSWLPAFLALGTIWGLSFLFISKALSGFTPFGVALFRITFGAVTLLILGQITGHTLVKDRSLWRHFFIVALLLNSFPSLMFAIGQQYVSSSIAGMLNATTPLFSMIFLALVFKVEPVAISQVIGLIIGFIGVFLLLDVSSNANAKSHLGIFLILAATTGYGFTFPYSRKFLSVTGHSSTSMAMTQLVFAVLILLPFTFFFPIVKEEVSADSLLSLVALGSLGTGIAYIWNFEVIDKAGSTIASTVTYLTPLVATLAGIFFLKERAELAQFIGGALVLLSAGLVQKRLRFFSKK